MCIIYNKILFFIKGKRSEIIAPLPLTIALPSQPDRISGHDDTQIYSYNPAVLSCTFIYCIVSQLEKIANARGLDRIGNSIKPDKWIITQTKSKINTFLCVSHNKSVDSVLLIV